MRTSSRRTAQETRPDEGSSSPPAGEANCSIIAHVPVPSIEDPQSVLKAGEREEFVTQYRIDKKTGAASFCIHGGYCYPRYLNRDGEQVEVLSLENCRIDAQGEDSGDQTIYDLTLDRSKFSKDELRFSDVRDTLERMGLCSACADNAAYYFVNQPTSECAALVKSALEGDPDAHDRLLADPDFCRAQ